MLQEEIEKQTQEHRKRMKRLKMLQEVFLLLAGVVNLLFGVVFHSTWCYIIGSFFIGWFVGSLLEGDSIRLYNNAEDMWRKQYFHFYNRVKEVLEWDGKERKKEKKKK